MRRSGDLQAKLLATALVVVATWFLHAYQFFWLQGQFRMSVNDTLFWAILGSMMVANVWIEHKHKKRLPKTGWTAWAQKALQVAVTFAFMAVLWSMWSSDSLTEWFYFLKSGNI